MDAISAEDVPVDIFADDLVQLGEFLTKEEIILQPDLYSEEKSRSTMSIRMKASKFRHRILDSRMINCKQPPTCQQMLAEIGLKRACEAVASPGASDSDDDVEPAMKKQARVAAPPSTPPPPPTAPAPAPAPAPIASVAVAAPAKVKKQAKLVVKPHLCEVTEAVLPVYGAAQSESKEAPAPAPAESEVAQA